MLTFWMSGPHFSGGRTEGWLIILSKLAFVPLTPEAAGVVNLAVRKSAHFIEYAVLGLLAYRAFYLTWPTWTMPRWIISASMLAFACAVTDEVRQASFINRTGSPWDVMLDATGAVVGLVIFHLRRVRRSRASTPAQWRTT